jgi:hypothetical protein
MEHWMMEKNKFWFISQLNDKRLFNAKMIWTWIRVQFQQDFSTLMWKFFVSLNNISSFHLYSIAKNNFTSRLALENLILWKNKRMKKKHKKKVVENYVKRLCDKMKPQQRQMTTTTREEKQKNENPWLLSYLNTSNIFH